MKKNKRTQGKPSDKNIGLMALGLVGIVSFGAPLIARLPHLDGTFGFVISALVYGLTLGLLCSLWTIVALRIKLDD